MTGPRPRPGEGRRPAPDDIPVPDGDLPEADPLDQGIAPERRGPALPGIDPVEPFEDPDREHPM